MSFKDTAKKVTSGSFITEGREKIDMEDVIRLYGKKGVTILGCDMLTDSKGKPFGAFAFKEDVNKFFFGGQILNEIAEKWVADYDGDYKAMSEALADEGGVKVLLGSKKSKNGNTYTTVEVVE